MARHYRKMAEKNLAALVEEHGIEPRDMSKDDMVEFLEAQDGHREEEQAGELPEAEEMNALARRIWDGQSVSLNAKERVRRIALRLRERGYGDLSGLDLPVDPVELSKGLK